MNLVSIFSVLSSAAVAIAVVLLANKAESKRLGEQVNTARTDELRNLLDEIAVAIADLFTNVVRLNKRFDDDQLAKRVSLMDEITAQHDKLWRMEHRLAVRIGPSTELHRSFQHLITVARTLIMATQSNEPVPSDEFKELTQELTESADRFFLAANDAVGPKLAGPRQ